jgi:hypothetical protein
VFEVSVIELWPQASGRLLRIGVEVTFAPRSGQRRSIMIPGAEMRVSDRHLRHGRDGAAHADSAPPIDLGPDPELPANDDGWPDEGPLPNWEAFGWSQGGTS